MNPQHAPVSLVPESAPFSAEQRAWLNGFLAGWLGLLPDSATTLQGLPLATLVSTGSSPNIPAGNSEPAVAVPQEEFPWHDPALPISERLAMASKRSYSCQLMSAMAQLDCGACGYVCQTYAEAIAAGEERSLTKCSPGGKETAQALKKLHAARRNSSDEGGVSPATSGPVPSHSNGKVSSLAVPAANGAGHGTRQSTSGAWVTLKAVHNLNGLGSQKHTSHVVLDLTDSEIRYQPGDSLAVHPRNCPQLVQKMCQACGLHGDEWVDTRGGQRLSLQAALEHETDLRQMDESWCELLLGPGAEFADEFDVLDSLQHAPKRAWTAQELYDRLLPLSPRLYSISSSQRACPGEVHLTVARVSWEERGRTRLGVASTMFADRLRPGDRLRVSVHSAHSFSLPTDDGAPLIMVGPGTGIAPFRAFLQERAARGATGPNWLFFGDQQRATDFLYEEELQSWLRSGVLTRLDTAFSRDQAEKIYVQHRMLSAQHELFAWLEQGATFCVCGDAKRMAKDVDVALHEVLSQAGGLNAESARKYVKNLQSQRRYLRDVY